MGRNVASLFVYAGGLTPLNLARLAVFQYTRWLTSCAIEWFAVLSFHVACSKVRPSTALTAGTNQSWLSCVVLSCSSRMDFKVGAGVWAPARAEARERTVTRIVFITAPSGIALR